MDEISYLPLFIVFAIAWVIPLVLSWLEIAKIPSVIVEITMGVVAGPYVLNWMGGAPYLDFLAEIGFLLLIFLAGLEIDVNKILTSFPRGKIKKIDLVSNSFLLSIFIYLGSLLVSVPFVWLLGLFIEIDLFFYVLIMPTVALSITVPILKAEGILGHKFGQIMLMEGAIATVMSIILIAIYAGVLKNGFEVELLLFSVIFIVFIVIYVLGKKMVKVRTFQKVLYTLEHAASQIRVRGTVALVLFFIVVARWIDAELVLGAFAAGVLLSLFVSKDRSSLMFKLDGMSYGFFIPIFFIMVGVNLDLSALTNFEESIPFIIVLTSGFFIIQIIPSMILTTIFGWKKALSGGILLTARMGLCIATAKIGLSLNVISTADNAGIVTAAILTSLIAPMAYKLFDNDGEQYHHVILLGGSRASLFLAERFQMHAMSCLTILQNKDIIQEFGRKNLPFKFVDQLGDRVLDTIKLHPSDLVVILTESKELNRNLIKYFRGTREHSRIISRMLKPSRSLASEDDTQFIDQDELMANHVEDMIVRPDSIASLSQSFDDYRVEEIQITKKELHRSLVKEVAFPPSGSLIIQRRGGEIFIPHGDTHLLLGDIVTVIGNSSALGEFRGIFEQ